MGKRYLLFKLIFGNNSLSLKKSFVDVSVALIKKKFCNCNIIKIKP